MSSFGANLKRLRKAGGLKARELARDVGVAPSVVSGWENNRRGLPETPTLFRLAKALRCSIEELLQGIDRDYDAQYDTRIGAFDDARRRMVDLVQQPEAASLQGPQLKALLDTLAHISPSKLPRRMISFEDDNNDAPATVVDGIQQGVKTIQEGEPSPAGATLYAVALAVDSMEPLLKRGMRLIVSSNLPMSDGDLAYVQLKSGERFAKIAARQDGGWLLSSANPSYPPSFVPSDQVEALEKVAYVEFVKG